MPETDLPASLVAILVAGALALAVTNLGRLADRLGIYRAARWLMRTLTAPIAAAIIAALDARITAITSEFANDGNGSLRSAVDRIERTTVDTQKQLGDHIDESDLDRRDLRRWLETLDPGRQSDPHTSPRPGGGYPRQDAT